MPTILSYADGIMKLLFICSRADLFCIMGCINCEILLVDMQP